MYDILGLHTFTDGRLVFRFVNSLNEKQAHLSFTLIKRGLSKLLQTKGIGTLQEIQPEFVIHTNESGWQETFRTGISEKVLWRNQETGASMALIRASKGIGMPRHSHIKANQFIFCLSGTYRYNDSGILLKEGSFYFNEKGHTHGPTIAEEDTVFLEIFDQSSDISS